MKPTSWLFIACLALLAAIAAPQPARAALVFCNRTDNPLEAAVGYRGPSGEDAEDWTSEGWWKIDPGQCARVYGQSLGQRFYFYYAVALTTPTKTAAPQTWSGKYEFCTDTKAFKVTGDGNCEGRGYITKPFQQLDLKANTKDYTLDFKTQE